MPKTRIYPVFLPHAGCPFQCIYCNQHVVTSYPLDEQLSAGLLISHFRKMLSLLVDDAGRTSIPGEIAFYGGTFTALPLETLEVLLNETSRWIETGIFTGIRFSTRPDGITPAICSFLARYPVSTVELGVQSLSDEVLAQSRRGYSVQIVRNASALVREQGWALGIQMMPGLPGDTLLRFMASVRAVIALRPAFARLYPTIVLSGAPLSEWYLRGNYQPLSLEDAVDWCARAYDQLLDANIPVARMGLHADPELLKPGRILAGPYHPAFGYLVRVHRWRLKVDEAIEIDLRSHRPGTSLIVRVPLRFVSEALGPGRSNIAYWRQRWHLDTVQVQGISDLPAGQFECTRE